MLYKYTMKWYINILNIYIDHIYKYTMKWRKHGATSFPSALLTVPGGGKWRRFLGYQQPCHISSVSICFIHCPNMFFFPEAVPHTYMYTIKMHYIIYILYICTIVLYLYIYINKHQPSENGALNLPQLLALKVLCLCEADLQLVRVLDLLEVIHHIWRPYWEYKDLYIYMCIYIYIQFT